MLKENIESLIFEINTNRQFENLALEIFSWQSIHCEVYRDYLNLNNIDRNKINSVFQIPFLPISFFKTHCVMSGNFKPEKIFKSSGTTSDLISSHYIKSLNLYKESFNKCFRYFWGAPNEFAILALLPSYLDRDNSSLVYMMDHLIKDSNNSYSGFYLNATDDLKEIINELNNKRKKNILLGVTFALLDFEFETGKDYSFTTIIETGGMKGRRSEMVRSEVHNLLKSKTGHMHIASEYGMTELLSQAYSFADGVFSTPPWMRILIRDLNDPYELLTKNQTGAINIIDLANIHSCCFIATDDIGQMVSNNSFTIEGRIDYSDIRGCNMLVV